MMGHGDPQRTLFYHLSRESFVPPEHPLRAIRPLIDDQVIRRACQDLYAPIGRPSIPPEQLFLALVGGYLLGVTSERKLVMELQCNMALRWFVGLNLDQDAWDASTFRQNRRRQFDESGVMEHLFDDTINRAMAESQTPGQAHRPGPPPRMKPRRRARPSANRGVRRQDETSDRRRQSRFCSKRSYSS
jgi:transposase